MRLRPFMLLMMGKWRHLLFILCIILPSVVGAQVPALTSASLTSNHTFIKKAREGSVVTLNFTTNTAIQTPVVTLAGATAALTNTGGNNWTAACTMQSFQTYGFIKYKVEMQSLGGTPGADSAITDIFFDTYYPVTYHIRRFSPADSITNAGTLVFRMTLSEPVIGATVSNFQLSTTGTATGTIASTAISTLSGEGIIDITVNSVSGTGRVMMETTGSGITDSAGNSASLTPQSSNFYTIDQSLTPPSIISFTPSMASAGTTITITGTDFNNVSGVTLGGTSASSFTVLSPTLLTAVVGTGSSGTISVTTSGGTAGKSGFSFLIFPEITSFQPTSASAGQTVTITGSYLNTVTSVRFGSITASSFEVLSPTMIKAVVGSGSSGAVSVSNTDGTRSLNGFIFLQPIPAISSFSPTAAVSGATITITGSNFNSSPSGNIVYFGPVKASVNTASATELIVTVPVSAGYGPITILNTATGLSGSSLKHFVTLFNGVNIPVFAGKQDMATGASPVNSALADFDGDGKPDIVVANQADSTVSVYRNNSVIRNISFAAATSFSTGRMPTGLAVGDLNNDGKPDIVVSNNAPNTISVLLNTGSGSISFAPKTDFSTQTNPYGIAIGDIDGDGNADIVVTNSNAAGISVFRNTSGGGMVSFTRTDMAANSTPVAVCIADIDGDSKPDIIVANQLAGGNGGITVHLNNSVPGTVSLAAKTDIPNTNSNVSVVAGDITDDGKMDIITGKLNSSQLQVLINKSTSGTPSFTISNPQLFTTADHSSLSLGNFNDNHIVDVVAGNSNLNTATVIPFFPAPGPPNYTFRTGATMNTNNTPKGVSSGDLDGDGKPDIIVPAFGSNSLSVFRNRTGENTPAITSFSPALAATGSQVTITGSGFEDLTNVSFGGVTAASFTAVSANTIIAVVGTGASGNISVTTTANTSALAGFTYLSSPGIISFSPMAALAGATITVTGAGFVNVFSVTLGGSPVASFNVLSSTTMTLVVGTGASGELSIATPLGLATRPGFTLLFPPTISAVTPLSAKTTTQITITGTSFTGALSVTLGGTAVAGFSVISSTTISAQVGEGSSGNVTVITANGTASFAGFVYDPVPVITGFSPSSIMPGGAFTMAGVNFNGAGSVTVGGKAVASFSLLSSTMITGFAGNFTGTGSAGTVTVTATTGTGSLTGVILLPQKHVVTSIQPSYASMGDTIAINGSNFFTDPSAYIVYFGPVKAKVISVTISQLTVIVPQGAGYEKISVLNIVNRLVSYSPKPFLTAFKGGSIAGFEPNITLTSFFEPVHAVPGDVDEDGKPDIIIINKASDRVVIYRNISQPRRMQFSPGPDFPAGYRPTSVAAADINGDGKPDIITCNTDSGNISVLRNTGSGNNISFAAKLNFSTQNRPNSISVADIDSDGRPDIIVANSVSNSISILRNTGISGNISFERTDFSTGTLPVSVCITDFDNDGNPDIAVANQNSNTISVFRNTSTNGTIGLAAKTDYTTSGLKPSTIAADDFDRNGKTDLIIGLTNSAVMIIPNTSEAGTILFDTTKTKTRGLDGLGSPQSVTLNDFTGDGKVDISFGFTGTGRMNVLMNASAVNNFDFGFNPFWTTVNTPSNISNADLDGDGKPDLIAADYSANQVAILRNIASDIVPTITSITPMTAVAGSPVTITGSGFDEISSISLANIPASSFTVLSPTTIVAVFGFAASGTITVTGDGGSKGVPGFISVSPPSITSITPAAAISGATITLTGSNFTGTLSVTIGGMPAASFEVLSSTVIKVTVGSGASGSISVTTNVGTGGKAGFIFLSNPPVITSFTPTAIFGPDTVTIKGQYFTATSLVKFGNITASFEVVSDSVIIAIIDAGTSGDVSVTTPVGTALKSGFVYHIPPPVITSFSPSAALSGTAITILGSNFSTTSAVKFGGITATSFQIISDTMLHAVVGKGATGNISVSNPSGTGQKAGFTFLYPEPVITAVSPMSALSGTTLTITGTDFIETVSVDIGITPAVSFRVLSSTTLIAVVGTGSSGIITVTTLTGYATMPGFIYVPPVKIIHDSTDICRGDTAVLRSPISSGNQWYKNGVLIPGATAGSYAATLTGTYKLIVTANGISYPSSNEVTITVHSIPVAGFTVKDTTQCLKGNVFAFSNKSTMDGDSAGVMHSKWSFGDSSVSDRRHPVHGFAKIGLYTVKLNTTNWLGCSSDTVVKTIRINPTPVNHAVNPPAICSNKGLTANITVPVNLVSPGVTYSYWKDSAAVTAVADPAAISVAGTYYAKADSAGCSNIEPVTVTINNSPTAGTITGDNTICPDISYTYSSTTAGGIWISMDTLIAAFRNAGTLRAKLPGTTQLLYTVTLSPTGCSDTSRKTVTVNPLPITGKPVVSGYTNDTLICFVNSLSVASSNTYDKYLWSTGASTSSVTVSANTLLSLKVGNNSSPCYSQPLVIDVRRNLTPVPQITRSADILNSSVSNHYQWGFNNKDIAGAKNVSVPIDKRGAYTVRTSIDSTCWQTSPEYIVVLEALTAVTAPKPFDLKAYPNPTNGNFNIQVKFERTTSALINLSLSNPGGVVVWSAKKVLFSGTTLRIPVNMALPAGTYTIRVEVKGEINTQQIIIM
jgi:hypothetical protein